MIHAAHGELTSPPLTNASLEAPMFMKANILFGKSNNKLNLF